MPIERHPCTNVADCLPRPQDATASVIAALFGLHPYCTELELFAQKMGLQLPGQPDNAVLRRGRLLEGAVAEAVREARPGWTITKANVYLRDPELRLGATPDFFIDDEQGRHGVLECKTVAPSVWKTRDWTDTTPPAWIALQTLTQMMLEDAAFGVIAALVIDPWKLDLHLYDVPRHPIAEQRIRAAVARFWDDVAHERPPNTDYERDGALLALLYPREVPGSEIDLRGDNHLPALLDQRAELMKSISASEKRKAAIEAELREKIGDNERALVSGWRVALREVVTKEHMRKASSSRRFFISRDEAA